MRINTLCASKTTRSIIIQYKLAGFMFAYGCVLTRCGRERIGVCVTLWFFCSGAKGRWRNRNLIGGSHMAIQYIVHIPLSPVRRPLQFSPCRPVCQQVCHILHLLLILNVQYQMFLNLWNPCKYPHNSLHLL